MLKAMLLKLIRIEFDSCVPNTATSEIAAVYDKTFTYWSCKFGSFHFCSYFQFATSGMMILSSVPLPKFVDRECCEASSAPSSCSVPGPAPPDSPPRCWSGGAWASPRCPPCWRPDLRLRWPACTPTWDPCRRRWRRCPSAPAARPRCRCSSGDGRSWFPSLELFVLCEHQTRISAVGRLGCWDHQRIF